MGLVQFDVFAGGFLVIGDKGGVDVFVKLTRHVVRHIEQRSLGCYQIASCQRNNGKGQGGFLLEFHGILQRCQIGNRIAKSAILRPRTPNANELFVVCLCVKAPISVPGGGSTNQWSANTSVFQKFE